MVTQSPPITSPARSRHSALRRRATDDGSPAQETRRRRRLRPGPQARVSKDQHPGCCDRPRPWCPPSWRRWSMLSSAGRWSPGQWLRTRECEGLTLSHAVVRTRGGLVRKAWTSTEMRVPREPSIQLTSSPAGRRYADALGVATKVSENEVPRRSPRASGLAGASPAARTDDARSLGRGHAELSPERPCGRGGGGRTHDPGPRDRCPGRRRRKSARDCCRTPSAWRAQRARLRCGRCCGRR